MLCQYTKAFRRGRNRTTVCWDRLPADNSQERDKNKRETKMEVENGLNEEINLMFDNLDEWLNDDNRIITYRWLSLTLNLHVNYAKHVLEAFLKSDRGKDHSLSVTYCIAGLTPDKVFKVTVVRDDELEALEASLSPPISRHVYSIQKARLKNADALYTTDFDLIKSAGIDANKLSAVRCPAAVLRTSRVERPRTKSTESPAPSATSIKSSPANSKVSNKTSAPSASVAAEKPAAESKSNAGFGRLFANAAAKKKTESTPNVAQNGKSENGKASATSSPVKTSAAAAKSATAFTSLSTKTKATEKSKPQQQKQQQKQPKQSVKQSKADTAPNKRRRIRELSSSDEELIISSPEPSPEPPAAEPADEPMDVAVTDETPPDGNTNTNGNAGLTPQIMQRKLVSKTYVNSEGFMVTEKVWESEMVPGATTNVEKPQTAPAATAPRPPAAAAATTHHKKETGKKSKSAAAPTGKQSSLMSFFQKK